MKSAQFSVRHPPSWPRLPYHRIRNEHQQNLLQVDDGALVFSTLEAIRQDADWYGDLAEFKRSNEDFATKPHRVKVLDAAAVNVGRLPAFLEVIRFFENADRIEVVVGRLDIREADGKVVWILVAVPADMPNAQGTVEAVLCSVKPSAVR